MKASKIYQDWNNNETDFLDYSNSTRDEFEKDIKEALRHGLLIQFIESISFFPPY